MPVRDADSHAPCEVALEVGSHFSPALSLAVHVMLNLLGAEVVVTQPCIEGLSAKVLNVDSQPEGMMTTGETALLSQPKQLRSDPCATTLLSYLQKRQLRSATPTGRHLGVERSFPTQGGAADKGHAIPCREQVPAAGPVALDCGKPVFPETGFVVSGERSHLHVVAHGHPVNPTTFGGDPLTPKRGLDPS